ncbi:MAG: type II toxin-antitoxin system prevent-host-death family antitoxin [Acidobacteria bacterium]|nr:type II toxin-antitoxin system prevent-host-death family antitoxin [Acidobacteriota bacterium]MBV9144901.1 type II toxin-antitoxin system prevent-host-death family antitoxin [Acidobacteriota bacterium]MBV9434492.1 type II toxin-antitoxin system prevent-host-death family antitoxin [Acidobacteriota bacterium]
MTHRTYRTVGAAEVRNKLSSLLDQVEKGVEILITRRGKPIGRLISNFQFDPSAAIAAGKRIRARAKAMKLGRFDWKKFKSDRDQGRP